MQKGEITVAAVQMSSQAVVSDNLKTCRRLVLAAAESGASVVVLPESFAFMGSESDRADMAERLGDEAAPIQAALRQIARAAKCSVVAGGMPEQSSDPRRPFNTCVVVDEGGAITAAYRKIHLFDVSLQDGTQLSESKGTTPGARPVLAEIQGTKFGLSICYDLRFPELYRALADLGAEVLLAPSAFTAFTGKDHWHILLRARAIEAQAFVVAPAQTGSHPLGRKTYGHSLIIDPWGVILSECTDKEGFAFATLVRERMQSVRASLPSLSHRTFGR